MSTTIDQKIVEMRFDNRQFEDGVSTTMSTLEKFKQKLNLTGASKGLDEIDRTAKKMNFSGLTNAVESVGAKFSALEVMGITALANITNSAVNAGKRIVSALTIDPIKSGFQEYETQINAVQTILANTESKGTTLQDVNRALDELNTYADKTIYNFTEMTRNIGTFTAAGVDLDTAVSAIQGIANLAAVSGSTSQQASTAMYQLSQALSSGTVKLMDWNSVVNAGMGGQVFQDALKQTARVNGIAIDEMIKDMGSFRETLSKGWLTADILTQTLNQFTMAAEEGTEEWEAYKKSLMDTGYTEEQAFSILKMANTATDAATKVKTFTQLWDTLKEAAQSGWTQTWEIIIGDFGEAKSFLTDISNRVGEMIGASAEARNEMLSGGLSSGWKQLLNEGIADEEGYKDTIKSVAKEQGIAIDDMIAAEKEHNQSLTDAEAFQIVLKKGLKEGTITSDMLTESVHRMAEKMSSMSTEELKAAGYTVDYVKQIKDLSNGLKDGSISMDEFAEKIMRPSGRENLIQALWNSFDGLMGVITPIKEAFREIFPRMTGEQIYDITVKIRDLTEKFKVSEETANNIKRTFKGLFFILDIGVEALKAIGKGFIAVIKGISGIDINILDLTASMGDGISSFRDYIKENDLFGTAVEKSIEFVSRMISKIKEFGSSLKIEMDGSKFEGFLNFFDGLWNVIKTLGSGITKAIVSITKGVSGAFGEHGIFDVINSGLLSGLLVGVYKFINKFSNSIDGVGDIFDNVKGILDDVRGCFQAYQDQLKANVLLKIAAAIGILTAALFVLSTIDPEALGNALVGITFLFGELLGSLAIFEKIPALAKGTGKSIALMIGMSVSILILAGALKKMSSIDTAGIIKGLIAVGVLMAELSIFLRTAKFSGKVTSTAIGIVILSSAMLILAKAVKSFGALEWSEIGKGLTSIGALLLELAIFTKIAGNAKHMISVGLSMVLLGASMKIFASAMKDFGSMEWSEIGKGLAAMGGALAEVAIAMRLMPKNAVSLGLGLIAVGAAIKILASAFKDFGNLKWDAIGKGLAAMGGALAEVAIAMRIMPKNSISISLGLIAVGAALKIIASSLKDFGNMQWEEIGKGLVAMGGALAELAIGLNLMRGTMGGSAALLIAAVALAIIAPVMKTLGSLSWTSIGKGLLTLAGAFTVIGVAGLLLKPLVPTLLALAGTFALVGLSTVLIGAGLLAIAAGITALSTALAVGATAIVAALGAIIIGILELIPSIARVVGEGIVELCKIIGDCAPQIAESALKLISEVMKSLATYTPQIVESLMIFLIGVINGLAKYMPDLIQAITNLVSALFTGVVEALNGMDFSNILTGVIAVGLMSGLIYALSGVGALVPAAMAGLLGVGAVVAELALVLAAIGALSKIPGLEELISSGGGFLEKIGTAIGRFIGGIVGGIAQGFTSSLPQIGTDLSTFMTNIQPFIDGARSLDKSTFEGVGALVDAILALTKADLVSSITSWITGEDSISSFAEQLVPFGKAMKAYSDSISGLDAEAVNASANAARALSELATNLPNSGGLAGFFVGENDLSSFASQLVPFGMSMKMYSTAVSGLNPEAVVASTNAAKSLAELANNLPNSGGIVSFFTGENDLSSFASQLVPFGVSMKLYSDAISGLNPEAVIASANAAKSLSELANNLPNSGGVVALFTGENDISSFGEQIVPFGKSMKAYADSVAGIDTEAVTASANAAKSLSELANNLPNSGGVVSLFTGDNDISTFGDQIVSFGKSMKRYADSVAGIDAEAVTASANAAKTISELASNLPNSGGLVALFTGDNSLSDFGDALAPFGRGMKRYADAVSGIDPEAVTASANAAKSISELATNLPNSGGVVALFTGDNSLSAFADALAPLGRGMKRYADAVSGIDPEVVIASANAAKAISELATNLPNSGGVVALFAGDNSLSVFADALAPLGRGMKAYADSVAGIDAEAIVASANAAKTISELATNLPNSGGLVALFTGENSLSTFGDDLAPFGRGMKRYADSVAGIDADAVTASANAAKALSELATNLPNSGGLVSLFTGDNDLSSFGTQLVPFGKGMKAYADSVSGIDGDSVISSANAAKTLSELANNIPSMSGGLSSLINGENGLVSISSQLLPFGRNLKIYSDAVYGINADSVAASTNAAKSLCGLVNNLPNSGMLAALSSGELNLSGIVSSIIPFGRAMRSYSDTIAGINATEIANSAGAASKLVAVINSTSTINTRGVESFVSAINTLGKAQVDKFVSAFSGAQTKMSKVGSDLINSFIKDINSNTNRVGASATSIISAFSKGLNSSNNNIGNAVTSIVNTAIKAITSKETTFANLGTNVITKFSSGITKQKESVNNSVTSVTASCITTLNNKYQSFYSAGSYLVDGFSSGISQNAFKATAKAVAMAEAALEAAEEALGIESPSKEFYKVGDYTGQGFVNALTDYKSKSYDASYTMADYARKGLSNAIGNISRTIDTDGDYQPTIRPVLDLSDVQSGASAISSLFSSGTTIGMSARVDSISSMMNYRNQNGGTADVVSAIDSLRKDLEKVGGTTYNSINGINYNDDAEISNAIQTIVRAAKMERRA